MWMISRGARNFVFLSRSGADKPEAAALAADLRRMAGVTIQIVRGDVTKRQDVAAAIAEAKHPIKGVVQAAMVLHVGFPLILYAYAPFFDAPETNTPTRNFSSPN